MRIFIEKDKKSLNRIIAKQLKAAGYSVDCAKFKKVEFGDNDLIPHYDV